MKDEITSRDRVMKLFNKEDVDHVPCFSGMGNVTVEGLKKEGIRFADAHEDPKKMAAVAATTYSLYGFESAVVPFDLGIEAEALGCEMNFYKESKAPILYPTVKTKLAGFETPVEVPDDLVDRGRVPVVIAAIKILKEEVGDEIAIGSYLLGPFTLAGQVLDLNDLLKSAYKRPNEQEIRSVLYL